VRGALAGEDPVQLLMAEKMLRLFAETEKKSG
jgi:hypothetical protein